MIRDNTDEAAQAADDYVSEHGTQSTPIVEIFGANGCNYCVRAQELCERMGLKSIYKNVDEDEDAFFQLHGRIGSWKTVPQIFWGAEHVGGYDDLAKRLGAIDMITIPPDPVNKLLEDLQIARTSEPLLLSQPPQETPRAALLSQAMVIIRQMKTRVLDLLEANTRYLLRARKSEELLFKFYEQYTMKVKHTPELCEEIEKHLKAPWA